MNYPPIGKRLNDLSAVIVDAAYRIHSQLGPGLLESVYEVLLAHDLTHRGHFVERQKSISFVFNGIAFDGGFRADLIIDQSIIIEVKAVDRLAFAHERQLLTYLRALDYRLGFVINFGAPLIKAGIKRMVN